MTRQLSLPLLAGLLIMPSLFCWLLLRRGYRPSLRRTVFGYTAILTVVGVAGHLPT